MGEAKRKGQYGGGYTGASAALEFLRRYLRASKDADIALRDAELSDGTAVVACSVGGFRAALTCQQVLLVADVLEDTMRKFPDAPEIEGFPDFILSLRHAASEVSRIFGSKAN